MKVKNVNGRSVRVGSVVVPACNVDLKQVTNGEWLAHFGFSVLLSESFGARAVSYSCGWSALDELWHVDEMKEGVSPTEDTYDDGQLEKLVEDIRLRGTFTNDHQGVFDRALARV